MSRKIESIDYSYFIKLAASRRRPNITRELTKRLYKAPKDSISLAESMPNDVTFPFENISLKMKDGSSILLEGAELGGSLQYIPTQGYPQLVHELKEFMCKIHKPQQWDRYELLVTNGSQCGISKAFDMCLDDGDAVLVQDPLYSGADAALKQYRPVILAIEQDEFGVIPEVLVDTLEDWRRKCQENSNLKMPKLLYLNPTASNPNGATIPLERRKKIYDICCKYNILILEDDAYYFIHFLEDFTPSFLSMDTEGRVLRLDSFSKVLCPGFRLGWITGPKQLINNIELHIQSSYLHASTLTQVITHNLMKNWGHDGLLQRMEAIRDIYRSRRDSTLASMEKHLKGLAEWHVPTGGMVVWIKVKGVSDVYDMLVTRGQKKLITFAPGHAFKADPHAACNYIRASYSKVSPAHIDKAMKLLAELIREEQQLVNKKNSSLT